MIPHIHTNFYTSFLSLKHQVQRSVALPLRYSIYYLFICLHSFLLSLAGVGEGNYWCGTAGEEAKLAWAPVRCEAGPERLWFLTCSIQAQKKRVATGAHHSMGLDTEFGHTHTLYLWHYFSKSINNNTGTKNVPSNNTFE